VTEQKRSRPRLLIVDDDPSILRSFRAVFEEDDYRVGTAANGEHAEQLVQTDVFDLCFLDLGLGDVSGLDLLPRLKQHAPWMRIVVVTGQSDLETALNSMRAGAADYVVKPCTAQQLRLAAERQLETRRIEQRLEALEKADCTTKVAELDSNSPLMKQVVETIRQVADTDATTLILGESGSGKGMAARLLHNCGARAKQEFVTVSCPSLSAELLESELFGHRRGAFTGAVDNKLGRVEQAEGGTLFLDEIGDFPLSLQPKLLRFLQDREYERVGDPVTRKVDVRIVAATNRDLAKMVKEGTFREDLYYRVNVINVTMPPLRERMEDAMFLAETFLARYAASYRRLARGFTEAAANAILDYHWPGNVRELQNVIERAAILCPDALVDVPYLAIAGNGEQASTSLRIGSAMSLEALERAHILKIVSTSSSLEEAAQILGIDISTLYRKRKQYGI